jgi:hypothetical protein
LGPLAGSPQSACNVGRTVGFLVGRSDVGIGVGFFVGAWVGRGVCGGVDGALDGFPVVGVAVGGRVDWVGAKLGALVTQTMHVLGQ